MPWELKTPGGPILGKTPVLSWAPAGALPGSFAEGPRKITFYFQSWRIRGRMTILKYAQTIMFPITNYPQEKIPYIKYSEPEERQLQHPVAFRSHKGKIKEKK